MKKHSDIYSVEYYLSQVDAHENRPLILPRQEKKTTFKILVQDHIKDSVYLIDA
ncbi:MAG: hypothetical protein KDF58_13740 [Alphaproteobacteria bacterium]|nr:hypothetical protein [Alphaproteobacteria bacterium]HRW28961.1 hypothetical protein [Emcibacteraceae bacterium]